jgi:putative ABC transport system substrate-binding protein
MRFNHLGRREVIILLGGATAWPFAARTQQPAMPVIGYLSSRSPDDTRHLLAAFLRGLNEAGYVEGQNVAIEYRWALGQYDRLPALAAELVRRPVAVITTTGGDPAALAAKAATSTIPIVFLMGDPVASGLAASYNRPGGNATGINILSATLGAKRLGLLHEMVPQAATIGVLLNPKFPAADSQLRDLQQAAPTIGLQIHILRASTDSELDAAFETVTQQRIAALAVTTDPFFDTRRDKLVALAASRAVPTIYQFREYVAAGGLMSYGNDSIDVYRQAGVYTGRILKGANPADLPVMQPTKFEFVINLKTAKALGLTLPSGLLSIVDEVIE